jgi:acyl-CoA dehydrogenase
MDFNDTPEESAFRVQARAWLETHAPSFERPLDGSWNEQDEVTGGRRWQRQLYEGGYAGIILPKTLGGRGGSMVEATVFAEEESNYRLPKGAYIGIGLGMALPSIMKHGTPEQVARFAQPTLRGEMTWCQLFSEPAAGSDLAALRTRAVRDGDEWVVAGQKVWSSWAHHADWGILLLRTDPTVPKHKGLTFFVVNMKSPGIEVRPIRQISGASDFNETFLTDVRIPDENRVGAVGEGWSCAMTVLTGERMGSGGGSHSGVKALIELAAATPHGEGTALDNSATRLTLANAYAEEQAERHFSARLRTRVSRGENPGAAGAMVKLAYASRLQKTNGLAMEFREMAGIAHAADDAKTAAIWHNYIWSTAMRIAGGADEVLRNQISERMLDMPGEIRADRDVPFNKL